MAEPAFNIDDAIAEAVATGPDMTQAKTFEGKEWPLPAEGLCRLRFVRYLELGKHEKVIQGDRKIEDLVHLAFELSGPKHQPVAGEDGKLTPHVIEFTINMSLNEKAKFFKLFNTMNHDRSHKHMAQMLGKSFLGTVVHKTVGQGDQAKTYANLADASGYTIKPPFHADLDGNVIPVEAGPQITPTKAFFWNTATKAMWDSLYIEGRYPDRKDDKGVVVAQGASKNRFQEKIMKALNFKGSAASAFAVPGAENLDAAIGEGEKPQRSETPGAANTGGASSDPLANI